MKELSRRILCVLLSVTLAAPGWAAPEHRVFVPGLRVTGSPDTLSPPTPVLPPVDGLPSGGSVAFDLAEVDFGSVNLSSASATRVLTVSNTGTAVVALASPVASPGIFSATNYCPPYLAAGLSCQVLLRFKPAQGSAYTGTVSMMTSVGVRTATLKGSGVAGTLDVTPSTLDFGSVNLGSYAERTLVLRNGGADYLVLERSVLENAPQVSVSASNCLAALAPGQACSRTLRWTPARSGALDGTLSVEAAGVLSLAGLVGQAQGPELSALPSSLQVPNVLIDPAVPSLVRKIQFRNTGNQPATGLSVAPTLPEGVTVSSTCGASLAVGAFCEVTLQVPAQTPGAVSGSVALFSSNAALLTVPVTIEFVTEPVPESPTAGLTLSPASLDFGSVDVGTTSPVRQVTLSNASTTPKTIGAMSGASQELLVSANGCSGTTLAPEASCQYSVAFRPSEYGPFRDQLTLTVGTGQLTQTVQGTGLAGELESYSPSASFGELTLGGASTSRLVELRNEGNAPLALGAISGSFALLNVQNTCPASLAAGAACTVAFVATPSSEGLFDTTYQMSAGTRTVSIRVSGEVVRRTLELSTERLSWSSYPQNETPLARSVLVTNAHSAPLSVSLAVSGPFLASTSCTSTLAAGASCSVSLTPSSSSIGVHAGTLTVSSGQDQVTASLEATVDAVPPVLSAGSVDFGQLPVGQAASARQVLVSNPSTVPVTLGTLQLNTSSAFSASHDCPETLAVGSSCLVQFGFTPAAPGADTGSLVGQTFSIGLRGEGAYGELSPDSGFVDFGALQLNSTPAVKTVSLTNSGTNTLSLSSIALDNTQSFQLTHNCTATLAPNASCTLTVKAFTTSENTHSGRIALVSSVGNAAIAVSSKVGRLPVLSVSPTSLSFGAVDAEFTSAPRTLTLNNTGLSDLRITSVTAFNGGAGMAIDNGCTAPVPAGGSCQLSVTVRPPVVNARQNVVRIENNTARDSVDVDTSYTLRSNPVTLSTPSGQATEAYSFMSLGSASAERVFTLRNNGAGYVRVKSISSSSPHFKVTGGTCALAELAGGTSCEVLVKFEPTTQGNLTGELRVQTSSDDQPATVGLSGTGVAGFSSSSMALSPATLTFAPVPAGSAPSTQGVTLTNNNTFAVTLGDFESSDTHITVAAGTCTSGLSLAAGASCTYSVSFQSSDPVTLSYQTVTLQLPEVFGSVSQQVVSAEASGVAPTLASLSVSSAQTESNTLVTLTGENYYSTATVLVNGSLAGSGWQASRVNKTTMQVRIGTLTPGTYNLAVTTAYGTSTTLPFTVQAPTGDSVFTTPGTYAFQVPTGVTSMSIVAVGGGGGGTVGFNGSASGGGGALGWVNAVPVTPGETLTVVVGAGAPNRSSNGGGAANDGQPSYVARGTTRFVQANGGKSAVGTGSTSTTQGAGGTFTILTGLSGGGGNGGTGAKTYYGRTAGGGGAGGYAGAGGRGGGTWNAAQSTMLAAGNGVGGGASGGSGNQTAGGAAAGGGGTGIYGQGAEGIAATSPFSGQAGKGGSPGQSTGTDSSGRSGGFPGGGGAAPTGTVSGSGGGGAVRIIWGSGRAFPATNVGAN